MKNKSISMLALSITLFLVISIHHANGQADANLVSDKFLFDTNQPSEDLWTFEGIDMDTVIVNTGNGDTTSIKIGNRQLLIIEEKGKTNINVYDRREKDSEGKTVSSPSFKGHWSGFEIGLNNFVNSDFSTSLDAGDSFMELNGVRSRNLNFNFLQYDLALSGNNIGLVTGLGVEINNYWFSNNNSITKQDGSIVPVNYDDLGINLDRTRLRAYYLNVPLLLEFQTNHARLSQRAHFSAGVIGGLNIGSNSRVVYKDNSGKNRDRVRDDFYMSTFRYGMTLRAGYRSVNLYANYYPVSFFRKDKGPEIYPFAIGFSLIGF